MTDKEKQIEEIKDTIDSVYGCDCDYYGVEGFAIADALYEAGYRKQVEGEWISHEGYEECGECHAKAMFHHNFCPNCGVKMKRR